MMLLLCLLVSKFAKKLLNLSPFSHHSAFNLMYDSVSSHLFSSILVSLIFFFLGGGTVAKW